MDPLTIEPLVSVRTENTLIIPKLTHWKSCCFTLNTSATKYFVQVSILASLIIYSATMLVIIPECNSQRNYSSLLLFCLGILTPTPKMWMRNQSHWDYFFLYISVYRYVIKSDVSNKHQTFGLVALPNHLYLVFP